ncbi:Aldo/keto reductase [Trametes sanguinea]|nr:Aldo/keto reductase [Trametes sanguinea]
MQKNSVCPHFNLNNGASMPAVGIGCWLGSAGEGVHVTTMVETALNLGYRHIDTSHMRRMGNEESVGRALKKTSVPRDDIFLTTKLDQKDHSRVFEALEISLAKLGVEYVDLYLMHWPMAFDESGRTLQPEESPTFVETWKDMEKILATGKAKAIGVSNFSIKTLSELLEKATVVPAVNQVELHPCLPQHDLLAFCAERGIQLTAYTPLGKHKFADDPTIRSIAEAHGPGVTPAHVLLSWGVQRGTAVIPKSLNPTRLQENLRLIELNTSEMDALNNLHKKPGMHRSMCGFHSQALGGSCFGWTYKQLGWEMTAGGIHL